MPDSTRRIHPTAIIDPQATLGGGVEIGPYCVITGKVSLGAGVRLVAGVHINGPTEIGEGTTVYPGACIGFEGQDVKFKPGMETAGVRIGKNCLIREHVTIHLATKTAAPTTVGDDCFLMANSHVGHDAKVGNRVVLVNAALLAGHSEVGDGATLSGNTAIHQFARVGRLAFLSGGVGQSMDTPPFCIAGERNRVTGINLVGLRRAGIPREQITRVRQAFAKVFRRSLPKAEMLAALDELGKDCPLVAEQAEFVRTAKRPICGGMAKPPRAMVTWLQFLRRGELVLPMEPEDEAV